MKKRLLLLVCLSALALPTSALAKTEYRVCQRTAKTGPGTFGSAIGATPGISCAHAIQIANRGERTDGDDGARFGYLHREWQCVTVARPDHRQATEFGCYTPKAFVGKADVTFILYTQAD
jgi:hypothetical protein